jgi:multicomponent Na+:H+ antiporter subunit D
LTIAIGIGVEGLAPYVSDAARTLMNPEIYIEAVLQGNR